MGEWGRTKEEDIKDMIEVKVKIPKKTIAFIINYVNVLGDGSLNLGNRQYGSKEVKELMENEDVRNTD